MNLAQEAPGLAFFISAACLAGTLFMAFPTLLLALGIPDLVARAARRPSGGPILVLDLRRHIRRHYRRVVVRDVGSLATLTIAA